MRANKRTKSAHGTGAPAGHGALKAEGAALNLSGRTKTGPRALKTIGELIRVSRISAHYNATEVIPRMLLINGLVSGDAISRVGLTQKRQDAGSEAAAPAMNEISPTLLPAHGFGRWLDAPPLASADYLRTGPRQAALAGADGDVSCRSRVD